MFHVSALPGYPGYSLARLSTQPGIPAMRLLCLLVLTLLTLLDIGPVPITDLLMIGVVLFRPKWFYDLVLKIYGKF